MSLVSCLFIFQLINYYLLVIISRKMVSRKINDKRKNKYYLSWFGLVYLFNGISTFVGYLMPMLFS